MTHNKLTNRHHKSNNVTTLQTLSIPTFPPTRSLSIQRTHRRHITNLNPAPLLHIRIVERRSQPALTLRHSQPKPHQMPPNPLSSILINAPSRPVLVSRPRVQHMSISKKLDITRLQNHMQRQLRRRLLQDLQRVQLRCAQRRDNSVRAGVVSPERGDVVGIDFVPHAVAVALRVQYAGLVPRILAFADFAFAVKVPVRRCERFDDVGVLALQGVVDVVGGGDVGLAAGEGLGDAEEAD